MARMTTRKIENIEAEIEALKARICRLRLERKMVELADAEKELLRLAHREPTRVIESAKPQDPPKEDS